ncbi:hypothetical protein V511_08215 [Mesotoga sp. Brook.08.YT.4.2.5.1]|nr:hypothetical protein V511_08215 [Mesotoga sp. Brook.08.YT.4.2.5.1]
MTVERFSVLRIKTCYSFQSEDLFFVLGQGDDSRAFGLQPVMKKQHSSETLFWFLAFITDNLQLISTA